MENTYTQRGNRILTYEGYIYNISVVKTEETRWHCESRACKGMLWLDSRNQIFCQTLYSHPPNLNKLSAFKFRSSWKKKAKNNTERPASIITGFKT